MVAEVAETDESEVLIGDGLAPATRDALGLEAEFHVRTGRAPWQQRVLLEHHTPIQSWSGDGLSVQQDLTRSGLGEAADQVEQGGLPAAAGADEDKELSFGRRDADVVDGHELGLARRGERLAHPAQFQFRRRHFAATTGAPSGPESGWYVPSA